MASERAFLVARFGTDRVALPLESVSSVALCGALMEMPGIDPPLIGAIRLGAHLVAVVDVAQALGRTATRPYAERRLIQLEAPTLPIALVCDDVENVVSVSENGLMPLPGAEDHAVTALVRVDDGVAVLLAAESLLAPEAAASLTRALQAVERMGSAT